jgi:hypothetical protein
MKNKRLGQVDLDTGELLDEGFVAYVAPKRRNGFQKDGWIAMTQKASALETLANADLGDEARRVFLILLAHLEHENFILTPQTEMAAKLKMEKANFSRAMRRLETEGVILRGPKIGRMASFKLNPEYGWKGSAKNHILALDQQRAQRMKDSRISGVIQGGKPAEHEAEVNACGSQLLFPEL